MLEGNFINAFGEESWNYTVHSLQTLSSGLQTEPVMLSLDLPKIYKGHGKLLNFQEMFIMIQNIKKKRQEIKNEAGIVLQQIAI